jgi:hypothetical protein
LRFRYINLQVEKNVNDESIGLQRPAFGETADVTETGKQSYCYIDPICFEYINITLIIAGVWSLTGLSWSGIFFDYL